MGIKISSEGYVIEIAQDEGEEYCEHAYLGERITVTRLRVSDIESVTTSFLDVGNEVNGNDTMIFRTKSGNDITALVNHKGAIEIMQRLFPLMNPEDKERS